MVNASKQRRNQKKKAQASSAGKAVAKAAQNSKESGAAASDDKQPDTSTQTADLNGKPPSSNGLSSGAAREHVSSSGPTSLAQSSSQSNATPSGQEEAADADGALNGHQEPASAVSSPRSGKPPADEPSQSSDTEAQLSQADVDTSAAPGREDPALKESQGPGQTPKRPEVSETGPVPPEEQATSPHEAVPNGSAQQGSPSEAHQAPTSDSSAEARAPQLPRVADDAALESDAASVMPKGQGAEADAESREVGPDTDQPSTAQTGPVGSVTAEASAASSEGSSGSGKAPATPEVKESQNHVTADFDPLGKFTHSRSVSAGSSPAKVAEPVAIKSGNESAAAFATALAWLSKPVAGNEAGNEPAAAAPTQTAAPESASTLAAATQGDAPSHNCNQPPAAVHGTAAYEDAQLSHKDDSAAAAREFKVPEQAGEHLHEPSSTGIPATDASQAAAEGDADTQAQEPSRQDQGPGAEPSDKAHSVEGADRQQPAGEAEAATAASQASQRTGADGSETNGQDSDSAAVAALAREPQDCTVAGGSSTSDSAAAIPDAGPSDQDTPLPAEDKAAAAREIEHSSKDSSAGAAPGDEATAAAAQADGGANTVSAAADNKPPARKPAPPPQQSTISGSQGSLDAADSPTGATANSHDEHTGPAAVSHEHANAESSEPSVPADRPSPDALEKPAALHAGNVASSPESASRAEPHGVAQPTLAGSADHDSAMAVAASDEPSNSDRKLEVHTEAMPDSASSGPAASFSPAPATSQDEQAAAEKGPASEEPSIPAASSSSSSSTTTVKGGDVAGPSAGPSVATRQISAAQQGSSLKQLEQTIRARFSGETSPSSQGQAAQEAHEPSTAGAEAENAGPAQHAQQLKAMEQRARGQFSGATPPATSHSESSKAGPAQHAQQLRAMEQQARGLSSGAAPPATSHSESSKSGPAQHAEQLKAMEQRARGQFSGAALSGTSHSESSKPGQRQAAGTEAHDDPPMAAASQESNSGPGVSDKGSHWKEAEARAREGLPAAGTAAAEAHHHHDWSRKAAKPALHKARRAGKHVHFNGEPDSASTDSHEEPEMTKLTGQLESIRTELHSAQQELRHARTQLQGVERERDDMAGKLATWEKRSSSLSGTQASLESRVNDLQRQLARQRHDMNAAADGRPASSRMAWMLGSTTLASMAFAAYLCVRCINGNPRSRL